MPVFQHIRGARHTACALFSWLILGFAAAVCTAQPALPPAAPGPAPTAEWTNSLGITFRPIPGAPDVHLAIWPVRVRDYQAFAAATRRTWQVPDFDQEPDHPAVMINWEDAVRFCQWLTAREQASGQLAANQRYRLPTEHEWNRAAWSGPANQRPTFIWGNDWPPPPGVGNFGDELMADAFPHTSPVGHFTANAAGFYDLFGNVWEWCADAFQGSTDLRVLKGGSWRMRDASDLALDAVVGNVISLRLPTYGFRLALETRP
jgi:formylglycine-generating enzyme required for sulfatase activity